MRGERTETMDNQGDVAMRRLEKLVVSRPRARGRGHLGLPPQRASSPRVLSLPYQSSQSPTGGAMGLAADLLTGIVRAQNARIE